MKLMTKRPAFWVTGRDVHYTTAKGSAASLCLGAGVSMPLTAPLSESDRILLRRSLADKFARG